MILNKKKTSNNSMSKTTIAGFVFKIAVDGVTRRACDIGDDHALLAENLIEQARFADVRLADEDRKSVV